MKRITIREHKDGDWVALYIDGKKVYENHSLHWADVLNRANIYFEFKEVKGDNHKKNFPESL